jgi:hypothetical protein
MNELASLRDLGEALDTELRGPSPGLRDEVLTAFGQQSAQTIRVPRVARASSAGQVAGNGHWIRPPRMRPWLAAAAVTATAAAAAVAVVVNMAATAPTTGDRLPTVTTAYVISRTERALIAAEHRNLIQETHTVGQGAGFALPPGPGRTAVTTRAVSWTYRGLSRTEGLTAAGRRVFDASVTYRYAPARVTISSETINDIARTWWRGRQSFRVHGAPVWSQRHSCPAAAPPSPAGSPGSNWPAQIRLALKCGAYHVAGTGQIDGVSAIKIVPRYQRPPRGVHLVSQAVWVSRSTYLPVRVRWSWPRGHGLPGGRLTGDFTWLEPTPANLASLRVTIPHGYRQLPPDGIGGAELFMAPDFAGVVWPSP